MALYKRSAGGSWWTRFSVRGRVIRISCRTTDRQLAEEYETALRHRYWRQGHLGESVHFWREAVARFKREAGWRASTRKRNEYALKFFERMDSVAVAAVNADVARAAREHVERSQKPASANRIMAVFRGVLRACVRWGWLTHCPPVPMVYVPDKEPLWLTPEQCERLLGELPTHLRAPALFSVLSGLRMSNVRDLTWDRVDLDRAHAWVPSSHYKTRRSHGVALSAAAVDLLRSLPQTGAAVFEYRGKQVTGTFNTKAFRKALLRAGLPGVRWHDLRHTFASWLASRGASDRVLQVMGGWASPKMAARYSHLRSEELRPWADAVGTFAGTALKTAMQPAAKKSK